MRSPRKRKQAGSRDDQNPTEKTEHHREFHEGRAQHEGAAHREANCHFEVVRESRSREAQQKLSGSCRFDEGKNRQSDQIEPSQQDAQKRNRAHQSMPPAWLSGQHDLDQSSRVEALRLAVSIKHGMAPLHSKNRHMGRLLSQQAGAGYLRQNAGVNSTSTESSSSRPSSMAAAQTQVWKSLSPW